MCVKRLRGREVADAKQQMHGKRSWSFYALATFFGTFVAFLYGPMSAIYILSFQGPTGGLTFPMRGASLHWFDALFSQQRTGDFAGAFTRSIWLAVMVLLLTVVISVLAGLAFRRRFFGATFVFYLAVASLIMPGLLVSLGIGLTFQRRAGRADRRSAHRCRCARRWEHQDGEPGGCSRPVGDQPTRVHAHCRCEPGGNRRAAGSR